MGDRRFDEEWAWWDRLLETGAVPADALARRSTPSLVRMIAAAAGESRPRERNAIATAVLNRVERASLESRMEARRHWDRAFQTTLRARALVEATGDLVRSTRRLLDQKQ